MGAGRTILVDRSFLTAQCGQLRLSLETLVSAVSTGVQRTSRSRRSVEHRRHLASCAPLGELLQMLPASIYQGDGDRGKLLPEQLRRAQPERSDDLKAASPGRATQATARTGRSSPLNAQRPIRLPTETENQHDAKCEKRNRDDRPFDWGAKARALASYSYFLPRNLAGR